MAKIDTRILVTNSDGIGRYLAIRTYDNRLTITDESSSQVMTISLTTSVEGDNTGDQTAATVPLELIWGVAATDVKGGLEELSGEIGTFGNSRYLIATSDPMLPNAIALANLSTGILRNTTSTGIPVIAVAGDFPILNQNTTGNAATATILKDARTINGISFNGSSDITLPVVTTSVDGIMSATDKIKLDSIAASSNNYTHPTNHPPSIITQDANNRFVTDSEKSSWNAKEAINKTVAVKTTNYTVESTDYTIEVDSTSNDVTISLPTASAYTGRILVFSRTEPTNRVIIDSIYELYIKDESVTLQSNGTVWKKI